MRCNKIRERKCTKTFSKIDRNDQRNDWVYVQIPCVSIYNTKTQISLKEQNKKTNKIERRRKKKGLKMWGVGESFHCD